MKLKALIVDDCPNMRRLLMLVLPYTRLAEFRYIEAEDGLQAWAKFQSEKVDIVFADWTMPKMSGIDFARKVRASEKANRTPIVMVTGVNTVGAVEDALDGASVDVYITKPYTVDSVRERLAKLMESMAVERQEHAVTERPAFLRRLLGDPD